MRSSFSRSLVQSAVNRRARSITAAWVESMSRVASRYRWRSWASMAWSFPRRSERRELPDRRQHSATRLLQPRASGHVGDREQEVPHTRGDVRADPRRAGLRWSHDVALGRDTREALANRGGAPGIAVGDEQRSDRARERGRVAARFAAL